MPNWNLVGSNQSQPVEFWTFDPTKYQFGFYGVIIVLMMLFRPAGLIPERRHQREHELGVADTPLYDVTTEGTLTDRDRADY